MNKVDHSDLAITDFFYANFEDRKHIDALAIARKYYEPLNSAFVQYSISYLKSGESKYAFVAQIKVSIFWRRANFSFQSVISLFKFCLVINLFGAF